MMTDFERRGRKRRRTKINTSGSPLTAWAEEGEALRTVSGSLSYFDRLTGIK